MPEAGGVRSTSKFPAEPCLFCDTTLTSVGSGAEGNGQTYAPRLRVQSERVVLPRSICMSQIIACGNPLSKRNHCGTAAVMSFVKYRPQSVPANTCCGYFGLAMIESTGTSGRLPVLLSQVDV